MTAGTLLVCLCIGVAIGLLAGMFGVGGGLIAVPCMIFLLRLDPHLAMGTSAAVIVPVAFAAALRQSSLGNVDWKIAALLAVGGMASAAFGAALATRLPPQMLQRFFALLLFAVGIKMLFSPPPASAPTRAISGESAP